MTKPRRMIDLDDLEKLAEHCKREAEEFGSEYIDAIDDVLSSAREQACDVVWEGFAVTADGKSLKHYLTSGAPVLTSKDETWGSVRVALVRVKS